MNAKKNEEKRFYYTHTENRCRVFCISCNKIAYSTEQNKYLNTEKCFGHNKLQCLNSSCLNGFSKTYYKNYVADNRSDFLKREGRIPINHTTFLPVTSTNYMSRYQLQN